MNSLHKYKGVQPDGSEELVLVNTKQPYESMEEQVHANHHVTTLQLFFSLCNSSPKLWAAFQEVTDD